MRSEQKQATREKILQIAKAQLESQGYEAATIRSIAQAAGVATGTVFVHFSNKEDLFYTAFYDDLEALMAQALTDLPEQGLEQQLTQVVTVYFQAFATRPALYSRLLKESLFAGGDWGLRFRGQVEVFGQRIAGLYVTAKTQGELSPDCQILTAVASFLSFYYLTLISLAGTQFQELEQPMRVFSLMLRQHLNGLAPTQSAPKGHTP